MEAIEQGVKLGSTVYFYTHSTLAQNLFFYPLCTGHFYCDETYQVNRSSYNSFLLIYVVSGSGKICIEQTETILNAGSIAMIDCYKPHLYASDKGWEIFWLHFDGVLARQYYELCTQNGNVFVPGNIQTCENLFRCIYSAFHEEAKPNEAFISCKITELLTEIILSPASEQGWAKNSGVIEDILSYIAENINKPLSLKDMAKRASLSPFYFSRLFKKETGYSPHEYLVRARVDKAKYLLKTTEMPLKEIAISSGFSSECTFSNIFKKYTSSTPLCYRNDKDDKRKDKK